MPLSKGISNYQNTWLYKQFRAAQCKHKKVKQKNSEDKKRCLWASGAHVRVRELKTPHV